MNNSNILFLYDALMTNPNGDPDEENRPRMDYSQNKNLVSDLRIKRYIRDYGIDKGMKMYVQKIDGETVTAANRVKDMSSEEMLKEFIDMRLFGAIITVKKENKAYTGPVQFNWGYSLNKVDLMESSITSHFSSTEKKKQGPIGKDYRVKYSFLAVSGIVSGKRAENTNLKQDDVLFLDEAMVKSIPLLATRSKIGQYPRLYLRVEMTDNESILKDLRNFVTLGEKKDVGNINEIVLKVDKLIDYLNENKNLIKEIILFEDNDLKVECNQEITSFKKLLSQFTIK